MLKRRNVGRRRNIKIRRIFKWPSSLPKLERGRGEHSRKLPRYPRRGCYLRILTSETLRSSRRPTSQPLPRFSFLLHASSSLFPPRRRMKVEEWKKVEIKIKIYIYIYFFDCGSIRESIECKCGRRYFRSIKRRIDYRSLTNTERNRRIFDRTTEQVLR